jgi:hypothetical protein
MAYRSVLPEDLVGKTVKSINAEAVNSLEITFEDGTKVTLWAEQSIYTLFGSIPGIFVDDTGPV